MNKKSKVQRLKEQRHAPIYAIRVVWFQKVRCKLPFARIGIGYKVNTQTDNREKETVCVCVCVCIHINHPRHKASIHYRTISIFLNCVNHGMFYLDIS